MMEVADSDEFAALTTKVSSHCHISMFFLTQNLYFPGKNSRTIMRNMTDKIIFQDRSDQGWASTLSRQMFPGGQSFLTKCLNWLEYNEPNPYERYLWLATSAKAAHLPSQLCVRSRIFPNPNAGGAIEPLYFTPDVDGKKNKNGGGGPF